MAGRPNISIYIATSLDGYIARKDNGLDWLDRVGGFDEDYGFKQLLESIDTLIIGRKTYEVAITVPDPYPGKKVVVLSRTLTSVREGMQLYRGDLDDLVAKLHADGTRHIWIDGGVTISQFLLLQKVDTMTLGIIPILLGEGIPLFNGVGKEIPCRLVSSQSYASGLVQLKYEIIKEFTPMKDKITFKAVDFGSDDYEKLVSFREKMLTQEELALEREQIHIAGFLGQELCATAVLVPEGNAIKMQRVAIKPSFRNRGIEPLMMAFCEEYTHSS